MAMRARLLKPEFFVNEELANLGPYAMLLFEGLWCAADREGRLEDRPGRLKALCLPFFDCDANELITSLCDAGFLARYEVDGQKYLEIPKFLSHQKPHLRESASTIPVPPRLAEGKPKARRRHTLGNPFHNLEKTTTETEIGIETEMKTETETGTETRTETDPHSALVNGQTPKAPVPFDRFWAVYLRHENKQSAREAFERLNPDAALLETLIADAATRYAGIEKDKIPHPSTYLHQKRWEDEDKPSLFATPARASPNGVNRPRAPEVPSFKNYRPNRESA